MSLSKKNLKANFLFAISAFFFFCLQTKTKNYVYGIPIATAVVLALSAFAPPVKQKIAEASKPLLVYSFLTAIGTCFAGERSLYETVTSTATGASLLGSKIDDPIFVHALCGVVAVLAVAAVFAWVLLILSALMDHFKRTGLTRTFESCEKIVFVVIVVLVGCVTTYAYLHSNAYYCSEHSYNVIFSTDSTSIFKGDAFLVLSHSQNDIRQPLFAAFALPFFGLLYLVSWITPIPILVRALLYNYIQLVMLTGSFFIIASMMSLSGPRRACFVVACSMSFMYLLYALTYEQYVVAFFWLVVALHAGMSGDSAVSAVVAAAGTLLVGAVSALFGSSGSIKDRLMVIVKSAACFMIAMLALCRFEVLLTIIKQTRKMVNFTSATLTIPEKFYQYFCFVSDCLFAPPSHELDKYGYPSWWFEDTNLLFFIGIAIFAIVLVSFVLNRKQRFARIALAWIVFSVLLLAIVGFGTGEGCLALYSLYFGWPFIVLLFMLFNKLSEITRAGALFYVLAGCLAIALLVVNGQGIVHMIEFANTVYPL